MADECRARGLNVEPGDALAALRALPDGHCGAVSAFHLIEHLPFPILLELLRECIRVLRPGGVVIFETPNPENVLLATRYFYTDPTHQRPLPPVSTQFMLEHVGFREVRILPRSAWPAETQITGESTEIVRRFNEFFYGPMEYGLVGRR